MQVIPTLLTYTKEEFISQYTAFSRYYHRFQIDVADGKFVPNTTLQINEIVSIFSPLMGVRAEGLPTRAHPPIRGGALVGRMRGRDPSTVNSIFDFHLMVNDFEAELQKLQSLSQLIKINVVFIHAARNPDLENLKTKYPIFSFGLVINPEETIETIMSKYDSSEIEHIQIMTIEPGFQGKPFIKELLNKFNQVKRINYKVKTYLDGGVNKKILEDILSIEFPPDYLGVGSFLTKAENLEERVKYLEERLMKSI